MINKTLLRIPECAEALGLGRSKIYALVTSGELRAIHIGRAIRIPSGEIVRFVAKLQEVGKYKFASVFYTSSCCCCNHVFDRQFSVIFVIGGCCDGLTPVQE